MKKTLLSTFLLLASFCFSQKTIEKKIYFDFDQSVINENSKPTLDSLVVLLKKYYAFSLTVNGYTDPKGNAEYNNKLADSRAKAVFEYMKNSGLSENNFNYVGSGKSQQKKPKSDAESRNCTLTVIVNDDYKIYKETEIISGSGSKVMVNVKDNTRIEVNDFFTNESMLANEMFAIDTEGNILQTAGMIEIYISGNPDEVIDGLATIKMPIQDGDTFDSQMTIWEEVIDKDGKTRWKDTNVKPTKDKSGRYYQFYADFKTNQRVRYNLDKPTFSINKRVNSKYNNEVIYIETYKNFHFTDIRLSDRKIKFAAKINDSMYAFVRPMKRQLRQLVFKGVINDSISKNVPFKAHLDYAQYRVDKATGVKRFIICEKCNYFINGEEKNKPVKPKEESGFWAWLKRLF